MNRSYHQPLILLALLALLVALAPGAALAQETAEVTTQQTAGPYDITVAQQASNLSLGRVTFLITVLEAESGEPVGDARVRVLTHHEVTAEEGWILALNHMDTPEIYGGEASLGSSGVWGLSVEVDSPRGKVAVQVPSVEIPAQRSYTEGSVIFVALSLTLIAGVGYVWWSARRSNQRRARSSFRRRTTNV